MNRKNFTPADFSAIQSYSIAARKSMVNVVQFADTTRYEQSGRFEDLLPSLLKGPDLLALVAAIKNAVAKDKPVVVGIGGHVIKCGLAPLLIDLIDRGYIDAIAMNGATAIHDLEIAFHGETSEDVKTEIKEGRFGMVEETAAHFNGALARYVDDITGIGTAIGRYVVESDFPHKQVSLLGRAYELGAPMTVHVAVGSDIVHIHPNANGAITGQGSMNDFKLFTGIVSQLGGGGVYINIGSAVILPEVFIKALSAARNLGADVSDFVTVNMDMLQHYRPGVNVVNRPIQGAGAGYAFTGHHEIMVPLLYHLLINGGAGDA